MLRTYVLENRRICTYNIVYIKECDMICVYNYVYTHVGVLRRVRECSHVTDRDMSIGLLCRRTTSGNITHHGADSPSKSLFAFSHSPSVSRVLASYRYTAAAVAYNILYWTIVDAVIYIQYTWLCVCLCIYIYIYEWVHINEIGSGYSTQS